MLSYFLADDTLSIFEPPQRNTGITGGKYLERSKVLLFVPIIVVRGIKMNDITGLRSVNVIMTSYASHRCNAACCTERNLIPHETAIIRLTVIGTPEVCCCWL